MYIYIYPVRLLAMLRKPFLFIALFLFATAAVAQNLQWAKGFMGAIHNVHSGFIAVDAAGSVYTTGNFGGQIDFDPGPGVYIPPSPAQNNCFIVKLDNDGNFGWYRSVELASPAHKAYGTAISFDDSGNVYTVGSFVGTGDFDPDPGVYNMTSNGGNGGSDVFLLKLDSAGNFVYAKQIGGTENVGVVSMTIDNDNNVYIGGSYSETADFDPGPGTHNLTDAADGNVYVLKLNAQGNFLWCKTFGDYTQENSAPYVAHDDLGNIYSGLKLNKDICLMKIDPSGNIFFTKTINHTGNIFANAITGICVDNTGNIYAIGTYYATTDFDPGIGTFNLNCAGFTDVFILKLDNSGNFMWAKGINGTDYEIPWDIAADSYGAVYTTGFFLQTVDFDPNAGIFNLSAVPNQIEDKKDVFLLKLSSHGDLMFAAKMGGSEDDDGESLCLDGTGNCYVTGTFSDTCDFDPGPGVYNLESNPFNTSSFVVKFASTASVDNTPQATEVILYPNPATNSFTITSPQVIHAVQITDMLGRVVFNTQPENYLYIVEPNLAPGIYHVSISTGNEIVVKKVMME
jgi:hypothetical protein